LDQHANLVISDADGMVLFDASAAVLDDIIEFDFDGYSSTLTVTTISSGLLLLYPWS
jgi:hypothetical protein